MDSHRHNELKETIKQAFRDVCYPGDDNIGTQPDDGFMERLEDFKGKHWSDLTFDSLVPGHKDSILVMSPQAYLFFLPAHLLIVAEYYNECDVLSDCLLASLICEPRAEAVDWFLERATLMTSSQKSAVRSFLEFIRDTYPPDPEFGWDTDPNEALESYWAAY